MCVYGKRASGDARSPAEANPLCHLLFVQGTAPVGERAVLSQGVGEFRIQLVGQACRDSLPDQDENHDHRRLTGVARSLAHQAE